MENSSRNEKAPMSSYEFEGASLSVQDALIVLAIRLMGDAIRENPPARQHIIALARSTPLFSTEDYKSTEERINRFVNWAGMPVMDDLFAEALEVLRGPYRRDALAWVAVNAVAQQGDDEMNAMLHHIGKALGFSATEVETGLRQARDCSTADGAYPD
jgi:hypothetical protein